MARLPRLYIEGCAQHIIQRGNNRDACFYRDADYAFYLQQLALSANKFDVAVHAYVLMTNHVHLLVTPPSAEAVSKMMQALGRSYVRYINITYSRTGTLWEGRFKSSIVDSSRYLLTVSKYIELNPVRANMVSHPGEYPWSSYRTNGMGVRIKLQSEHPEYQALSSSRSGRLLAYRGFVEQGLDLIDINEIRICANKGWVLGSEKFKRQIKEANDRRITKKKWGGGRKSKRFKFGV